MDGEAVSVAFPSALDAGPGDWRTIHPAKLASYCVDQDITLYTYKHTNLERSDNPFAVGNYVIKPDYDDPDQAVVMDIDGAADDGHTVSVAFHHQFDRNGADEYIPPADLAGRCDTDGVSQCSYSHEDLVFTPQY